MQKDTQNWNGVQTPTATGIGREREWESGATRQGVCNKFQIDNFFNITFLDSWRREGRCAFGERCKFFHDGTSFDGKPGSVDYETPPMTDTRSIESQRWRDPREGHKDFYKTKLCEKYNALGRCPYEDRCTYAHGYEELRPYSRTPFDATHIPEPSEKDGAGMSEAQSVASERFRGRDVQSELIPFFQESMDVTYLDKVKAICSCVGIGSPSVRPGAVSEAMADIKSKSMLKGNLYADDVQSYI